MTLNIGRFNDNVTIDYRDNYGNIKKELDIGLVQQAFFNTNAQIQSVIDHINFMHRKIDDLKDVNNFMQWIDQVHPELKRDYVISQRVASRLEEGPGEAAVCEAG
jgi:hypothetical protein